MKPYYEHGGITIYHGDCREVLPQLEPNSVDLIVTDPPYGVEFQSSWRQESFAPIVGDHSQDVAKEGIGEAIRVLQYQRHLYVFGRFDFSEFPITQAVELIWDKHHIGMGDLEAPWGSQHEYIQFFVNWKRQPGRNGNSLAARMRKGTILKCARTHGELLRHPTEKPVELIRELIESSSRLGETVLDPFLGSGSTTEAAKIEGRRAIGIEIEEKYCEIAAKRLSQEVFDFPPKPEPTEGRDQVRLFSGDEL